MTTHANLIARMIRDAENAGETDVNKTAATIARAIDQIERREIAALGSPFMALVTLIQYADWTIGPESLGHHPTMPSAVSAAKVALRSLRRGLMGSELDPPKAGPVISFGYDVDDETRAKIGEAVVLALTACGFAKDGIRQTVTPEIGAAMARTEQALTNWQMIEALRGPEGNSVEILCDNPDGLNAVVCSGEWTHWVPKRFEGTNTHEALHAAFNAFTSGVPQPLPAPEMSDAEIISRLLDDCAKWITTARWRTTVKMTPEGARATAWLAGEHSAGNSVVVIIDLLRLMDKAIRAAGAKTCASLQPSGVAAIHRLRADGAEYLGSDE